jgi:hypothetical protein
VSAVKAAVNARRTIAALIIAVAGVAGGCGSGDGEATSPAATVPNSITDEVNAACRAQLTAYDERPNFPVEGFDPENPDPAQLPDVAAYFEANNFVYEEFLARLEAIDPPPEQREALAAYVDASREDFRIAREQQAAAVAKDVDGFVATLDDVIAQSEKLNDAARALGADDCVRD